MNFLNAAFLALFIQPMISSNTFALGVPTFQEFQGNGSRLIDTATPSASLPVTVRAEDLSTQVNTSTSFSYNQGTVTASAATADYSFNGSLDSTGYNTAWRSGGYFHDELYFESFIDQNANIDFVFNVQSGAQVNSGGRVDLVMSMSSWDGLSYTYLDSASILSSQEPGSKAFNGTITVSSSPLNNGTRDLLGSKNYLPLTIGLWGDVVEGALWWDKVSLTDVIVSDGNGSLLSKDSYILRSANGSLPLAPLENPVSAVPVPGAVWLLGSGLASLMGIRRLKFSNRRFKNVTPQPETL